MDDFTHLKIRRFKPEDVRLGRHIVHDERSRRFPFRATRAPRRLTSTRHEVHVPIMDQGNVGSCTGHAGTATIASAGFWISAQAPLLAAGDPHTYAVGVYADATALDPWPGQYVPDDTGSDGLSVAKVLNARGLISGYQHAFSLEDALGALAERVVMIGSSWRTDMFYPDRDGRVRITGKEEGGHEYALDAIDVEDRRVWIRNSWGPEWGIEGRAWLAWDDLGQLLEDFGDCTVLVPRSEPPPQPEPAPDPKPAADRALAEALRKIVDNRTCPAYLRGTALEWLKGR